MQLTGAEIVIRCLQEEGVEYVFGYPGGAVLYIYDELFKQDKVKHVLVRHEQGAVHAADGYSRSSQKVGVALVTSGPGVTNAVTGIATAYMDSIPMVVITGQVPTHAIGQDAFQECDTVGITRPCVKHNFLVKDVERPRAHDEEGVLHRHHRPARARCWSTSPRTSRRRRREFNYPETVSMRSYNPVTQGPRRPDQEGGAAAARGRSGRWSTPAAASILDNASAQLTRARAAARLSRAPTR